MGIVRLQGMTFYGFHGVSRAERETGRRYEVDCELTFDFSVAGESDMPTRGAQTRRLWAMTLRTRGGYDFLYLPKRETAVLQCL